MSTPDFTTAINPTKSRRDFILNAALLRGEVADGEIIEAAGKAEPKWATSSQSFNDDAAYFQRHNHPVIRPKGEGRFVAVLADNRWTYELRMRDPHSQPAKKSLGELAARLLLTSIPFESAQTSTPNDPHFEIIELLEDSGKRLLDPDGRRDFEPCARMSEEEKEDADLERIVHQTTKRIREKIITYFAKSHRHCAIDAGSTCAYAAQALRDTAVFPARGSRLCDLTVFTNCLEVASTLKHPDVPISVVLLGGRLRKSTIAFTGELNAQCLEAWNSRFDIALIGTTSLNAFRLGLPNSTVLYFEGFHCDSEDEARTKSSLLQRSALRIVLMDADKFQKQRSSAFPFAEASSGHVDVILTDDRVFRGTSKHDTAYIKECLRKLWRSGIAVLVARKESSK